ncbi:predicted protein [Naegleria gruberi]|uniref:Predicted protein n=1 Tax=Naegleria gruberi TaxID=5762 RepID=D2W165_NAEGR|nr:uncharacterized protein NAEGRDRAFT_75105 [Naegleria gruberi]EFC37126.1 predicted protein [Naegleria gruberi]|eukprot:XP_002669870.1 predicted protein [Naegleria gruberi strain NEG-M]
MYSKFSIVQFTTLSYIQPSHQDSNCLCMDVSSSNNSAKNPLSIGHNHVELMPKKRGRPIKNEPKSNTQMVITSTESLLCRSMSNRQTNVTKRQHRDSTCWERRVKPKPATVTSPSSSMDMHTCISNTPSMLNSHTYNYSQPATSIHVESEELPASPHGTVQISKKRIIRSSISIKELLN